MECNKKNMELWVKALRSKRFKQGRSVLHHVSSDTYCCMGVASVVAIESGINIDVRPSLGGGNYTRYDDSTAFMPKSVQKWLGLNLDDPVIGFSTIGINVHAVNANDKLKWSFEKIASELEKTYGLKTPWYRKMFRRV